MNRTHWKEALDARGKYKVVLVDCGMAFNLLGMDGTIDLFPDKASAQERAKAVNERSKDDICRDFFYKAVTADTEALYTVQALDSNGCISPTSNVLPTELQDGER